MKKLINMLLAGKSINTSRGELTFDKDGVCTLEDDVADAFKSVRGFVVESNEDNDGKENPEQSANTPKNDDNDGKENPEQSANTPKNDDNATNDDVADEDINLDSLSVPSLKKYAREHGVDITGLTTKEPIIKAIKEAIQK